MFMFAFAKHPIVSYSDGRGGTITYYYYDEYTWIVAALALAWLTWFLVSRYRRARAMRRPPRRSDHRTLNRVVKIKNEFHPVVKNGIALKEQAASSIKNVDKNNCFS